MKLHLLGEFDCTADAKGRVKMPSQLLKQLGEQVQRGFVIARGFETYLTLYPRVVWDEITEKINHLNYFNKKNRDFIRHFQRGASEVELDEADRFLIPKRLLLYANIQKDVVVTAFNNHIEIWSPEAYNAFLEDESIDFSDLAESILGIKQKNIIEEANDTARYESGASGGEYAKG